MGDEESNNSYRFSSHTTKRISNLLGIGVIGVMSWGVLSLLLIVGLLTFGILNSSSQKQSSPADLAVQDNSLFASVLEVDSIFGFTQGEDDPRAAILEEYLITRKSPMASAAKTFIEVADQCPMDWTLLPAIAGKESAFGRIIPINSYNAFGWAVYTGQNHGAVFTSWDHAIEIVGKGLCENYIKQGRNTPELIEQLYTPQSARTHGGWRTDVTFMMEQIRYWK